MTMKSRFKSFLQPRAVSVSEWILIISVIVMIGFKFSTTANAPNDSSSDTESFYKINGIDTRGDYVQPPVDVMPQW